MMNGDVSESESDYYEDIRPRHPYDGFYLRHRATIDAQGRKICSHEIPPTPSPSLSPPPDLDPVECPPDSLTEGTTDVNGEEHVSFLLSHKGHRYVFILSIYPKSYLQHV